MQKYIARILKWQSQKYLSKNKPTVVVVSGSVGKTSTTQAIAAVLTEKFKVKATLANYNTDLGVPLSIFGEFLPTSLKNPLAWIWIFIKNQIKIINKDNIEIYVLELGTDSPGDLEKFSWLNPEIAIVTAVAPEHMEYFKTLDAVAKEELSVASYSEKTIINKLMVKSSYLKYANSDQVFNYSRDDLGHLKLDKNDLNVVGDHSIDAIAAGIAVGKALNMKNEELATGAKSVKSLNGRMSKLTGIKNTTLIDDTYNSSPEAVRAALDYMYQTKAPQRIVLLGNMNELGDSSKEAHEMVGMYCDPKKLDLVVTLGQDANKYTAQSAKDKGCFVLEAETPYEAADIIKSKMIKGSLILLKGSQNGVFAEEAVKKLLENQNDVDRLVRQSPFWQKKKQESFKGTM